MKSIITIFRSFGAKITLILILSMLFSGAMSNFLIYKYALDNQFGQLRDKLKTIAVMSALGIDADALGRIPLSEDGVNSPDYKAVEAGMRLISNAIPSIKYIYTLAKTGKPGILKFIVDLENEDDKATPAAKPGEEYDASGFPQMLAGFGIATADDKMGEDKWGVFLSGYAPVRDSRGFTVAIVGVDMTANDVYAIQKEVKRRAAFVLMLGLAISVMLGVFMAGKMVKPVKRLVDGTRHIAKGELQYRVEVKGEDEIAELGRSFNNMSEDLTRHIDQLKRTTAEKERLLRELEIAKGIQESFLPDHPPAIAGFDIAAISIPARVVGGDFYDFIPLDKDKWGLVVADVSGKGVPAALFMALSRTLVRASTIGKPSIAEGIKQANRLIIEDSKTNMFVTLFYMILNSGKRSLEYLNAGHNPPLLVRESSNDIVFLKAQGAPLGLLPDLEIKTDEIELKKGDLAVLYTDGVTEAVNAGGEQFETDRLLESVKENRALSPSEIIGKIEGALKAFVGDRPQFDDITLMVIKVV